MKMKIVECARPLKSEHREHFYDAMPYALLKVRFFLIIEIYTDFHLFVVNENRGVTFKKNMQCSYNCVNKVRGHKKFLV